MRVVLCFLLINLTANAQHNFKGRVLDKNGLKIISGYGSDVLGSPLNVLEWSINHLSERGKSINAGDIISTGTCTGIIPILQGDKIVANFIGLDTIKLNISN